jgi:3-hydroxyacyl-CoA dehydrogenase
MRFGPVEVTLEAEVGVISVDSPPVNTITAAVREGLFAAIADIRARPGVAAVVLICEGSTFFSGADIAEFAGPPKEAEYRDLFRQLEGLPVPVVAGMHGVALRFRWLATTGSRCRALDSAFPK